MHSIKVRSNEAGPKGDRVDAQGEIILLKNGCGVTKKTEEQ